MLPGHETEISTTLPARGQASSTGTAFVAGLSERGSVDTPILITSARAAARRIGGLVNYASSRSDIEEFFRKGGTELHFARVVGPGATPASVLIEDSQAEDAIKVAAASPGEWGNALSVDLTADPFQLTVSEGDVVVEVSPELDDKQALIEWSIDSSYVRITDEGGGDPVAASDQFLDAGADDRANITNAEWEAALERFDRELGPGQVLAPGQANASLHEALLEHAVENNRWALLDASSDASATVLSEAGAAHATGNGRGGAIVAPAIRDGRTVPASILVAARLAYTDATAGPGQYAAGSRFGDLDTGEVTASYTDSELEELNRAGVQVIRQFTTGPRIYGFRSLAGPDSPWTLAPHVRVIMALRVELDAVMEEFVLRKVDGPRFFVEFEGALAGPCRRFWSRGDLFGATEEEAYSIQADEALNPPESLAESQLNAAVAVKPAAGAERILLNLTKASVADTL